MWFSVSSENLVFFSSTTLYFGPDQIRNGCHIFLANYVYLSPTLNIIVFSY